MLSSNLAAWSKIRLESGIPCFRSFLSLRAVDFNLKKNFRASGNLSSFLSFLCEYFTAKKIPQKESAIFIRPSQLQFVLQFKTFASLKKSSGSYQNELARF